ncbi:MULTISPECIES: SufD family Fe-S cluster assembly protein [unclassified Sphingopyxis]|uniref:SufD family Fe-S cluster assembly protein n=1 Tax=unclassified Sphingopyxis TaxID=2614943 RepID=UPI000730FE94|nr:MULTISPECIES: SufD family Fe-S cluster assembly protein [unclassified Sphingopyxis]KTE26524.1 Fe-S cluster assembly protein SufD [Sphingopyxis sp. H057]KTE52930.1 Fe-S cluster assembly protein SufD [Sphingopyxis sp. H073]KTE55119.1 Fe-S cluster assembly protein SufD [Sphingopyxis sp. H071]KTE59326.1 Fe-S cluster assembly protein SufD [Sphingopyxis sp. H107]KTE64126.1 Fe-S cluster assembly protein SufD [Sphingopyxis sp. H100]
MTIATLPTRRDEAWRYSDIDAVTAAWPLPAPESIIVPAGGKFARAIVQDAGDIRQIELVLGKGAVAHLHVLNIGGAYGRIELAVTLHEGADFRFGAAQIGGGEQNLEIVTTVTHAEPGATSRQVVRSVLGGTATGTYLGKVAVARDAQQTDSEQDVKAMLLDRSATANAKPELEIFADDVKCAHGCAIGELDAMALYYLQSRGLPPAEAKKILLQAFVAGVFDGAEDEERLQALALAKLGELV